MLRRCSPSDGSSAAEGVGGWFVAPLQRWPRCLPDEVAFDRDGKLILAYAATNERPIQELYKQLHSMLAKLRMEPGHLFHRFAYMKNEIPVAGVAHQAGTCRMGADPATSVVNADCRAHGLDNLYVVDTSVFPSIGAVNPALTAMANSLRVGDHLRDRLK